MSAVYSIYRIVNFRNGKVYVGQTNNPDRRKANHFHELKNGIHYNKHLQAAYDKYGQDSFYFEILESGIDEHEIDSREIYWIGHFASNRKGYNKANGGANVEIITTPCEWNGVFFNSVKEASEANGVRPSTMSARLRRGYKRDGEISRIGVGSKKSCVWNGNQYESISHASRITGIPLPTLTNWIKRGFTGNDTIKFDPPKVNSGASHPRSKPITWNGLEYPSINMAAKALGLHIVTMLERIQKGYRSDNDMPNSTKGKRCIWNNIEYASINQAAKAIGVSLGAMKYRLKRGYTSDQDINQSYSHLHAA